jgi:hypothetical protein
LGYTKSQKTAYLPEPENCYIVTDPPNWRKATEYVFFRPFKVDKTEYVKFTIHGRGYSSISS